MNLLLLNNQVIVYLFSEILLLLLSVVILIKSIKFIRYWDFNSFSNLQLSLEKEAYLTMTIATFLFTLKLFLLIFFIYTIDTLSTIIPGAMCAAGVISANSYGMSLLFTKLTLLFTLLLFLIANKIDLSKKDYPLFTFKSWVLIVAVILIFLEFFLDINYFTNIDTTAVVSCCSSLYGNLEGANPLPFGLDIPKLLMLFYLLFFGVIISFLLENRAILLLMLLLFGVIAYYSVVYFFGTYIYELPTHKCPFCMFQKEYYYIGYLLWGSLFFGLFFGVIWVIMSQVGYNLKKLKPLSMVLLTIFVSLSSLYVGVYYLKNGVLL